MGYQYETHLHTRFGSRCAGASGKDYIQPYLDAGYTGIFVTDHFFAGNCAVDQSLPWKEQVECFCRGYEDAKEEGDKRGLQVFFGWEQNFTGDEYLIYGLDKAWLLEHPEVKRWTRRQQLETVHACGGCVVQAHPFRDRDYLRAICLSPDCIDAVEVYNAANRIANNVHAYHYAKHLGLPMFGGSDIHSLKMIGNLSGIEVPTPLTGPLDLARRVREGAQITPLAPIQQLAEAPMEDFTLPVVIRDRNDQPLRVAPRSLLR